MRTRNRRQRVLPDAFAIIVVGMILGIIVWKIGLTYLGILTGSGTKSTVKQSSSISETVLKLPEFTFWTCQIGVFNSLEKAEQEQSTMHAQGWEAQIFTTQPWSVGIGLGHSPEELQEIRSALTQKGIVSIPKKVVVHEQIFRVTGNKGAETIKVLQTVNSLFKDGISADALSKSKKALAGSSEAVPVEEQSLKQALVNLSLKPSLVEQKAGGLLLFAKYEDLLNKLLKH